MQIFNKRTVGVVLTCIAFSALSACGGSSTPSPQSNAPQAANLSTEIDSIMASTLSSTGVSAATVTVMKNGVVLHSKGYGYLDAKGTTPLPESALMVTASIVKPVTAAAIQQLASRGKLALTDHVFCNGANSPCWLPAQLLSASSDARAGDITIAHLVAHQGGWNIDLHGGLDFDKQESLVQQSLGLPTPPVQDDDIRYFMAKPLDFAPGTQVAYTNFGYLLLGRIVELASQTSYLQYVQSNVLGPIGVASTDFGGAASLLANRDPREPNYITSIMAPSLFAPGTQVIATNGAINAPNWVSATTAITTSKAMATFAANYLIDTDANGTDRAHDGQTLAGTTNDGFHYGNYPGTSAIVRQLPSGVTYAVLMNKSDESGGPGYQPALKTRLDAAIAAAGL